MFAAQKNYMQLVLVSMVFALALFATPSAFAGHAHYSVGFYGPGYGINYSNCHHCRGGYRGGYYAPAYYPAFYRPYYRSYYPIVYEAPVVVRRVYREVEYYEDDDSYYDSYRARDRQYEDRDGYYHRAD